MNIREIKELMDYCETKNLMYFEYINGDKKMTFSKGKENSPNMLYNQSEIMPKFQAVDLDEVTRKDINEEIDKIGQEKKTVLQEQSKMKEEAVKNKVITIKSPFVGQLILPEKSLEEGVEIKKEEMLFSVEAMKIYNDVYAPANGKIIKVLVENGSLIEYGQIVMELEVGEL